MDTQNEGRDRVRDRVAKLYLLGVFALWLYGSCSYFPCLGCSEAISLQKMRDSQSRSSNVENWLRVVGGDFWINANYIDSCLDYGRLWWEILSFSSSIYGNPDPGSQWPPWRLRRTGRRSMAKCWEWSVSFKVCFCELNRPKLKDKLVPCQYLHRDRYCYCGCQGYSFWFFGGRWNVTKLVMSKSQMSFLPSSIAATQFELSFCGLTWNLQNRA